MDARDRERYARHLSLAEVGIRGQERLLAQAARVVGSGRAAEEAALYLCAAGVGRLVLEADLERALGDRLAELNPGVRLVPGALEAVTVAPRAPERRADGARAALLALVVMSGAGPLRAWEEAPWTGTGGLVKAILAAPGMAQALAEHAAKWFPKECCALLLDGQDGPRVVLAENLADRYHKLDPEAFPRTAERAYILDPRLIARAEDAGQTLVAIVHSHCRVGAYFSDEDARAATSPMDGGPLYPGVAYVVLDAQEEGVRSQRVFGWSQSTRGFVEL